MGERVKISEAVATLIWQVASAGEPVELALFRDWMEAYHLARVREDLPEPFVLTGRFAASDADWPRAYEDLCDSPPDGKPAAPDALAGFAPVEQKPSPWAVKKKRIMDLLEAALKRGVTRGQIAEASGGKLDMHTVMDFIDRKQKKAAEWDALSAALEKLEGVSGDACADV